MITLNNNNYAKHTKTNTATDIMINGILYILYQTDVWQTKASHVCFGVFDSFEHANEHAKENDLYSSNAQVVIKPVKINQFAEVI